MRISDWSSDVCSSDLAVVYLRRGFVGVGEVRVRGFTGWGDGVAHGLEVAHVVDLLRLFFGRAADQFDRGDDVAGVFLGQEGVDADQGQRAVVLLVFVVQALVLNLAASCRSEEHTSELQSLLRIPYAVFCLTK